MTGSVGDFHNFGQAVRRVTSPDGTIWFEKPRPVYWEWLFFGKSSPLAVFFENRDAIFGLTIEFENEGRSGRSKEILATPSSAVAPEQLFGFGYLLAYAYAFGIQDIFAENTIRTPSGLQVIDAEIVFSKFTLPNESFLFPFRNCAFEKAALSHLLPSMAEIDLSAIKQILRGFCELLSAVDKNRSQILERLSRETSLAEVPIRILLRETSDYRSWQTREYARPLLSEEVEQLKRGDIPYFFKLMGDPGLFYFGADETRKSVLLPKIFEAAVSNIAVQPSLLLEEQRIRKQLFPFGVIFLLRKLLAKDWVGEITDHHFTATVGVQDIAVSSPWGDFSAKRS